MMMMMSILGSVVCVWDDPEPFESEMYVVGNIIQHFIGRPVSVTS